MELRENTVKIKVTGLPELVTEHHTIFGDSENRQKSRSTRIASRGAATVSYAKCGLFHPLKADRTQNSKFTELKADIELKIHRMWMYRCFIYKTRACVSCASRTSRMSWSRSLPLLAGPET